MSVGTKSSPNNLPERYAEALQKQMRLKPGAGLQSAARLGREALASGLDMAALVKIHERAILELLPFSLPLKGSQELFRCASRFFVEALVPFGSAHRISAKADGNLKRTNETLVGRTAQLAVVRRELKRETGHREVALAALEVSRLHNSQLLTKSLRMQEQLRRLSREIISAHESERRKISRELHDEIGQILTAINVKLATLGKEAATNTSGLKKKIAVTQRLVEKSMNTVHRFARELRPPLLDDLGLVPALHSFMKEFTKRTHIPIRFRAAAAIEELKSEKCMVMYRVAQEAFTNIDRHAEASSVAVSIQKLGNSVCMEIHDDGKSFDVQRATAATSARRLGLLGMRERVEMVGGNFTIVSEPRTGTTIRVTIPVFTPARSRRASVSNT